jgi:signal transduction histidine kinase
MRARARSTAYRLGAALAAILVLFGAALLVELGALRRIAEASDELAHLDHLKHITHFVAAQVREQYIHQAHTIIAENESHLAHYREVAEATRGATRQLVAMATSEGERARAETIAALAADGDRVFRERILDALARRDRAALLDLHARTEAELERTARLVDEHSHGYEQRSATALARTGEIRTQARSITIACFALAILVATVVFLLVMRSILRPLAALHEGAERVGRGDLGARIALSGRSEFADLAATFNQMTADLARNQEVLVRAHKLASIGQVAAGVAHEINNPLGVILGYVKILRREAALAGSEELKIIEDEANQCRRIVHELLDLARPQRLELADVDLGEIARDAAARLAEVGARPAIAIAVPAAGEAAPVLVRADEAKTRQVVVNVLTNAVEAATTRVTVRARRDGDAGVLEISDDGAGMTEEVKAHVFEPFFTTKRNGTGMGLAIAQAIVEAHGGRIDLVSAAGEGTRVSLRLPSRQPEEAA